MGSHIVGHRARSFPVAGIVFEDLLPANGKFEVFAFRNGVTVRVNGVTHLGTAQPSAVEIEKSLNGEVTSTLNSHEFRAHARAISCERWNAHCNR